MAKRLTAEQLETYKEVARKSEIVDLDSMTFTAIISEIQGQREEIGHLKHLAHQLIRMGRTIVPYLPNTGGMMTDRTRADVRGFPGALDHLARVIGGDEDGTTTYRQMAPDSDGWECTKCEDARSLTDGTPSEHHMHYCPGCGRRIVAEEPWRYDDEDEDDGEAVRE